MTPKPEIGQRKNKRLYADCTSEEHDIIITGARLQNRTLSNFIVTSALKSARNEIQIDRQRGGLSKRISNALFEPEMK